MNYLDWNNAIAAHFFNPEAANRPVYLYVTHDLIDDLGAAHGAGASEFVSCVLRGPEWIKDSRLALCGRAHRTFRDWRNDPSAGEREYPPYLAYLALFVLAAGSEGDFAPHAYYPRLRNLLGEDGHVGMPNGFNNMWELWIDLEEWSKSDRNGELGEFDFRISGDWRHVGLPVAQTLLSESDRRNLPQLFLKCALDSTSPPTDAELRAVLRSHAGNILQRRTRRLLSSSDSAAQLALLHAVASELEHWGGIVDEGGEDGSSSVASVLRLCCHLDSIAMTVRMRLRCKATADFPESGLVLAQREDAGTLVAEEHGLGWSSELSSQHDDQVFNASSVDWTRSLELHDDARGWRVMMPPATVRVFQSGASVGLPGYVEASRIARDTEFIVAACQHLEEIREWGANECKDFRELKISSGLPANWRLFRFTAAISDTTVRDVAPRIALPSSIRVQVRGGISAQDGSSSRFFSFAPPAIVVDGPTEGLNVTCDGEILSCHGESGGVCKLPSALPVNQTIRIEATTPSGDRSRKTIQLVDAVYAEWRAHDACFGPLGQRLSDGTHGAIGSSVEFVPPSSFDYRAALVPIQTTKAFLIGRVPGQVWEWPSNPAPAWSPTWVVMKEKRFVRAVPCMADLAAAEPVRRRTGDRESVRLWKKVMGFSGRRFSLPADLEFAALWNRYRRVARHV